MEVETSIQRLTSDSSIEITKNSKGFNWVIKAYGRNGAEIKARLDELKETANQIIVEAEKPSA